MPDRVCDTCHVPKPDICYEHAGAKARRPCHAGTCSSCFRTLRAPVVARYWHSEKGKAKRKRDRAAHLRRHPEEHTANVAAAFTDRKFGR